MNSIRIVKRIASPKHSISPNGQSQGTAAPRQYLIESLGTGKQHVITHANLLKLIDMGVAIENKHDYINDKLSMFDKKRIRQ